MDSASTGTGPARPERPTVAIAGATGFVGRAVCEALADSVHLVGLTRSSGREAGQPEVAWRVCDLFSLRDVEQALEGADVGIYLVHSMLPTARLTQGSFADFDLLLADNFARAAEAAGVDRILYVGGLLPEEPPESLSPHLRSRLEVEHALASRGARLTALRCGIIVGRGSSSLWIVLNLVRRLPLMVLPRWTGSSTQPIALADLVRAIRTCLADDTLVGAFDLGGPDVLSYGDLMRRTARVLGLRRFMIPTGVLSPRFSKLWVRLFGSAPRALVDPLVDSLRHDFVARDNALLGRIRPHSLPLDRALAESLDEGARPSRPPSSIGRSPTVRASLRRERAVRSVQRLPLPSGRSAEWAAREYLRFLPRFTHPWIRVETREDGRCRFHAGPVLLLELRRAKERSTSDRQVFHVTGGVLLRAPQHPDEPGGRLEFREVLGGGALIAAIHDFRPALPWFVYNATQARVHLWVMRGFARHLERSDVPESDRSTGA